MSAVREVVELACVVARRDFGPIVARVLRALLRYPGLRHDDIRVRCGEDGDGMPPSPRAVDDSLAVLISHGIVYLEARRDDVATVVAVKRNLNPVKGSAVGRKGDAVKGRGASVLPDGCLVTYKVREEVVLKRVRSPRYLKICERMFGAAGMQVARLLCTRGKLTAERIVRLLEGERLCGNNLLWAGGEFMEGKDADGVAKEVEDAMIMMAKSGIIRTCGGVKEGLEKCGVLRMVGENADAEVIVGEVGNDSDEEAYEEKRKIADTERKMDLLSEEEASSTSAVFNRQSGKVLTGRGRARRFVPAPVSSNANDFWVLSTWALDRTLRNTTCQLVLAGFIGVSRDAPAPKIFRAGLDLAVEMEEEGVVANEEGETDAVALYDILRELEKGAYDGIDEVSFQDELQKVIDLGYARVPDSALSGGEGVTSVVFLPGKAVFESRYGTLRATIRCAYDTFGLRIWNALAISGCMQEKLISQRCLMGVKEVRALLFRMMRAGYVSVQEVPKTNEAAKGDRMGAVWYLWRAEMIPAQKCILHGCLSSTLRWLLVEEDLKTRAARGDGENLDIKLLLIEGTIARQDQAVLLFRDFQPIGDRWFRPKYWSETTTY